MFLLLVFVFSSFLEGCEGFTPKVGEMIAQERQAFGIQFVNATRAVAPVAHQACPFQDAQVLRNGRA